MRLFVAVELGPRGRERASVLVESLSAHSPRSKWVRPEAIHVTLAFLGSSGPLGIDPGERPRAIEAALAAATPGAHRFYLGLGGGGSFGPTRTPRVLWAGLSGDVAALLDLERAVRRALEPLGYTGDDRPFAPHVTLARARERRGDPGLAVAAAKLHDERTEPDPVTELVLFQSELTRAGPRHIALARLALGGDRSRITGPADS
jgi:RNA 2',3'-cyclic 3'-phosphodiesterase